MPGPREKLNSLLGISPDGNIDSFLADLETTTAEVDSEVRETVSKIDKDVEALKGDGQLSEQQKVDILAKIGDNLKGIDELITLSTNLIKHLYTNIVSTDLIDAEVVDSAANLIAATHDNVAEYITLYRDREQFYEKVQLALLKHRHNLEYLERKYELEEKLRKAKADALSAMPENLQTFDQEKIVQMLKQVDGEPDFI
jgi:hypothetical protein